MEMAAGTDGRTDDLLSVSRAERAEQIRSESNSCAVGLRVLLITAVVCSQRRKGIWSHCFSSSRWCLFSFSSCTYILDLGGWMGSKATDFLLQFRQGSFFFFLSRSEIILILFPTLCCCYFSSKSKKQDATRPLPTHPPPPPPPKPERKPLLPPGFLSSLGHLHNLLDGNPHDGVVGLHYLQQTPPTYASPEAPFPGYVHAFSRPGCS